MVNSKFHEYLPAIQALNQESPLTKQDLLTEQFLINRTGNLEMYYAPHNEYINNQAKIVIVGITPGWSQMKAAFEQTVKGLKSHHPTDQVLEKAKIAASFAGSMRSNLINMLDQCGIPGIIDAGSSSSLFIEKRPLLHTTSIIKYPVFLQGENYTGHKPAINRTPLLSTYAYDVFPIELRQIKHPALIIPLGKVVERSLRKLLSEKQLPDHSYLFGFPHPSGANGHRKKQFQQVKDELVSVIKSWSKV
ncbi:hypothetical protein CFK37_06675 [Virgibacillus phasianinus]|uniref:Uracil-DNA glycosylase-like domain-containing protein n=1 Tax=Virgibacillus phasianinus TaxID=2017483 RepID=A0A220U1Q9_9BACI|nr:hypothetical protein CFK37_06675 [Virgibacillus phasianinus]